MLADTNCQSLAIGNIVGITTNESGIILHYSYNALLLLYYAYVYIYIYILVYHWVFYQKLPI